MHAVSTLSRPILRDIEILAGEAFHSLRGRLGRRGPRANDPLLHGLEAARQRLDAEESDARIRDRAVRDAEDRDGAGQGEVAGAPCDLVEAPVRAPDAR